MPGRYGSSPTAQYPVGLNGHGLHRVARPQPWKVDAACSGADPDLFYPPRSAAGRAKAAEARAYCDACSVRLQCLAFALGTGEELGIWGGCTERDRRFVRQLIVRVRAMDAAA